MNIKKFLLVFVLSGLVTGSAFAARVDTVTTISQAMHKQIKAVIITPEDYQKKNQYPVVYLLHGFSDNYSTWIKKVPAIQLLSDLYKIIIVCPDGGFASWYIDSPEKKDMMYDTYISKELVSYVDSSYSTIRNRSGRAICGLSMGGHGALYLAIKHQDVYGAAGSMSGGVDLRPFPKSFGLDQVLGSYEDHKQRWADYSVTGLVPMLKPGSLAITIDEGTTDFFLAVNNELHELLLKNHIDHDYCIRPGGHTWEFWADAINYQMLFFNRFFKGKDPDEKTIENDQNWKRFIAVVDDRMKNDWPWLSKYAQSNTEVPAPAKGEDRVVFMGNSITENWNNIDPDFFKSNHYICRGIGGQTSSQMLVRFREDVINLKPKAVVISAGTNDIAENTGPISLENIMGNIISMAELARASGIKPVLTSVLPASEFTWHPGLHPAEKIIRLNAMIKAYALKNHLVYVDYWSAMKNEDNGIKPELALDKFVHPNMDGYKIMEPLVKVGIRHALSN